MGKTTNACGDCGARCCKYVAMEIDKPETISDFDNLRWYVSHKGCAVFCDDGTWYFEVAARCRNLGKDNLCGIYLRRPRLCRDYGTKDCENSNPDYAWDVRLVTVEDVEAYVREKTTLGRKKPPHWEQPAAGKSMKAARRAKD